MTVAGRIATGGSGLLAPVGDDGVTAAALQQATATGASTTA